MPILTDEAWAQIRADYEHSETPIEDICAEHGISSGTLRDRRRRWDWTPRRQPIPADGPPPLPPPRAPVMEFAAPDASVPAAEGESAPPAPVLASHAISAEPAAAPPISVDPAAIAQRLQGAVARVLPAIDATLGKLAAAGTHPREMERAARALAALTRTLRELNALLGRLPTPADDGPDNLDDFRRDLARKMDAVIASRAERSAGGE